MSKFDFITTEFIRDYEKATGIRIHLDIFPFKYLGVTDEFFMADKINFTDGTPIPAKHKAKLLGMVRKIETELLERKEYVTKRERKMGKPSKQTQLELF